MSSLQCTPGHWKGYLSRGECSSLPPPVAPCLAGSRECLALLCQGMFSNLTLMAGQRSMAEGCSASPPHSTHGGLHPILWVSHCLLEGPRTPAGQN